MVGWPDFFSADRGSIDAALQDNLRCLNWGPAHHDAGVAALEIGHAIRVDELLDLMAKPTWIELPPNK